MDFLSVAEVAEKWNLSSRSIRNYCVQGRIPGAFLTGKTWNIPSDAVKPLRANARMAKSSPLLQRLQVELEGKIRGGIYHKVQIELTYNSNHIEGSKLSMDQTRLIFETVTIGVEQEAIKVDDIIETSNHFRAIDYIISHVTDPLSESIIKDLHRLLKQGTSDSRRDWFAVGDYKKLPNEVGGRKTTPPEEVSHCLKSLLNDYGVNKRHTLEDLVDFYVRFEAIHPFQDGNGRVGRLILFKECLANNIVPFIITDEMKAFYYRGPSEWNHEKDYLLDTCLAAQGRFKEALDYFRIPY